MRRQPLLFALVALASLAAADPLLWPAEAPVASEFGAPNLGSPVEGLLLSGDGLDIRAAAAGEVSYHRSARDARSLLPSALGDTLVVEGQDGMAALYAYLPALADPEADKLVSGALIGRSEASGLLGEPGFLFALYDRASARWVNPRVFLPKLPDVKAPLIRRVSLEAKGKIWNLGEQRSLPQGSYSILIDAAEQEAGLPGFVDGPPWYLRLLVNGEMVAELQTEIAAVKDGRLSFYPESAGGADFLAPDGSIRIPPRLFSRGRISIELLVRDFAGNERSAAWTLLVE